MLCLIFGMVYEAFSHHVYTAYMTCMFLFPLIGGAGVYALLELLKAPSPDRFAINAYNSAIAAFTVGSTLKGVFIIAGTNSDFWPVFWIAGGILALAAVVRYIYTAAHASRRKQKNI